MIKKKPPHTPLQTIRDYSLISCDHYWGWKIPKKVQSKYHCAFMVIKTNLIKILGKKKQISERLVYRTEVHGKESTCNAGDPGLIRGLEDPLEEGMATHSSILAWRIPWTEEPGGLLFMGSQRVGQLSN